MSTPPGWIEFEDTLTETIGPQEQPVAWRWATVTQSDPLRIRLDSDTAALPVTPASVVRGPLDVDTRVWVQIIGKRVIVVGAAQGYLPLAELASDLAVPKVATGYTPITPEDEVPTYVTVSLPTGLFSTAPTVVATANSSTPGTRVIEVSVYDVTTTDFRLYIYRTSTTTTYIHWIAVQA